MSHTPGPWKVGYSDGSGAENIPREGAEITDAYDNVIVRGGSPWGDIAYGVLQGEDARLIAAAPELLEALKNVLDHGGTTAGEWVPVAIYKQALAAIAKAEGREA